MLIVNWSMIKEICGVPLDASWQDGVQVLWSYAQKNSAVLGAGAGGFLMDTTSLDNKEEYSGAYNNSITSCSGAR